MLRGSFPAKIDEKSRLKIPRDFLKLIEEKYGRELFVTSLVGDCVRLYPMPVWVELERHLGSQGLMRDPSTSRFFQHINYYGQAAEIDNQGRVLIHPRLREKADMAGEVDVVGQLDYLEVWNLDRLKAKLEAEPFTEEDAWQLVSQRRQRPDNGPDR
jgi:MraZ protein